MSNAGNCGHEGLLGFVLVAPGPKQIPDPLAAAWSTAASALRQATQLTIIGYSFPPFDAAVRELFLKDFIVPHLRAEQRATLTLVDRSASTRQAIKGWFAGAVNNVIPEFGSFEEYVHTIACLPKNRA